MYKNNSRDSSKFEGCSSLQLSCILKEIATQSTTIHSTIRCSQFNECQVVAKNYHYKKSSLYILLKRKMTMMQKYDSEYIEWLGELKQRIKNTQIKAALSANKEIIELYWEIGKELYEKQENQGWGNSVVDNLEKDLSSEFPDLKGFSRRNLFYMLSIPFINLIFQKCNNLLHKFLGDITYSLSVNPTQLRNPYSILTKHLKIVGREVF